VKPALLLLLALAGDPAFDEAERLATTDDGRAAIAAYEDLLAAGHDTQGVRYNLGTLYLERGDVGHAMLHLTAAARFVHDDDVAHNLEVARRVRKDRVEGRAREPLLGRLGRAFTAELVVGVSLGGLTCFALLAAVGLARRNRWLALLSLALLAVAALLLGARVVSDTQAHAVVLDTIDARVAPDDAARSSFTAHEGLAGVIRKEENGYLLLRLDNGLEAWLPERALGRVPALLD
jgi:hypothetical protein